MCEEDLEDLQRLETIFARVERKNSDAQIKSAPIQMSPRVQMTMPEQDTSKARTAALEELATQTRVQQKIFTKISKLAATPKN